MDASQEMPVHLHRVTTIEEYESDWGLDKLADWPTASWKILRTEVESLLAHGGALWEWEYRSERGLTGTSGLAVVRDGVIVRKWQLWKA